MRFFARDAHRYWLLWDERERAHLPRGLRVDADLDDGLPLTGEEMAVPEALARVDIGYGSVAGALGRAVERVGEGGVECRACRKRVESAKELVVVCPTDGCSAALHLTCAVAGDEERVVPLRFKCRACFGTVDWVALVKEASVRTYGGKLVKKILKGQVETGSVWMSLDPSDEESDGSSAQSVIIVETPD